MIEVTIKDYLDLNLSVPVYLNKPSPGGEYVVFEKTGSGKGDHLPSATIAFQSYAGSLYRAMQINEEVKEAVESMVNLDEVRGVSLNGDYNYTDITTKEFRYQAVYEIRFY